MLTACQSGTERVRSVQLPAPVADKKAVLVAWDVEHIATVKRAEFDFSAQFCQNTVRGGVVTPAPVVKTLIVSQIDGQDVSRETAHWMSPGEHVLDYKVMDNGVLEKQGQLRFEIKKGRQYFLQAQLYDYEQIKMEACRGHFYRLLDNDGLTQYPVCNQQVSTK